ncbi:MAG: hypothetical protein KZQ83_10925 [gamma proteobacterium symbiont of Taylorina sp.]|nr:hypothetical protein [gamma proteobacterium symbiont of Taylorina sp.]
MIGRLLVILGIFFLVWIGYRFLKKTWGDRIKDVEYQNHIDEKATKNIPQIKACAYCKTHIPETEGINKDGNFFCSYEHLDHYLEQSQNR